MTTIEHEAQILRQQVDCLIESIEETERKFGVEIQLTDFGLKPTAVAIKGPRLQLLIRKVIDY